MQFPRISVVTSQTDPCKRTAVEEKNKILKKEQHNHIILPGVC